MPESAVKEHGGDRRQRTRTRGANEALHFLIPGMELCVSLDYVNKVLPLVRMQPVPGGPDYLQGLMNLHGRSTPVLDLATRLGQRRQKPYTLDTPLLLCSDGERQAGLIIDEVLGVKPIAGQRRQMTDLFKDGGLPFLAVFNTDRGLTMLLDVQQVLNVDLLGEGSELHVDMQRLSRELARDVDRG